MSEYKGRYNARIIFEISTSEGTPFHDAEVSYNNIEWDGVTTILDLGTQMLGKLVEYGKGLNPSNYSEKV